MSSNTLVNTDAQGRPLGRYAPCAHLPLVAGYTHVRAHGRQLRDAQRLASVSRGQRASSLEGLRRLASTHNERQDNKRRDYS